MGPKIEDFEILSTIGSGSHGTVRKVKRHSDGQILVWKELNYRSLSEEEKKGLVLEVNILRELRHPYIVRFLHHIVDRRSTTLFILMEYCPGGDLKTLINKCRKSRTYLEEGFIWRVLKQLTDALKACHRPHKETGRVVLHRDLKPANVFLDGDGNVKLGDFGLARTLNSETSFATTYVGTPYYMSPEVVDGREYNAASDIWSLGCMIYELCSLQPPFKASTHEELHQKIREARYSRIPVQYSLGLQEIIALMITYEDFLRPSALMVLHHPLLLANTAQLEDTQTYPSTPTTTSEYNTPTHNTKNISTYSKNTSTHSNKSIASQNSKTSALKTTPTLNAYSQCSSHNQKKNINSMSDHSNCADITKADNASAHNSNTPSSSTYTSSMTNTPTYNTNLQSTYVNNSIPCEQEEYLPVKYDSSLHQNKHKRKPITDTPLTHKEMSTFEGNALAQTYQINSPETLAEENSMGTNTPHSHPPSYKSELDIVFDDLYLNNEASLRCRNVKISKDQKVCKGEFQEDFSPFRTHLKSKIIDDSNSFSNSANSLDKEYCKVFKEKSVVKDGYDQEFSPFRTHIKSSFQKTVTEDDKMFVNKINKGTKAEEVPFEEKNQEFFPFITQKMSRAENEEIVPGNKFNCFKSECEIDMSKDIVPKHNESNTFAILTKTVDRINKVVINKIPDVVSTFPEGTLGSSEIESDLDVSIDFDNCGAMKTCFCEGLSADVWQSRSAKVREAEAALRKREMAVEISERELAKREHKVSQMEREARQHLVRAQIFLRQSRPRSSTATTPLRPASDLDTTVSADIDEMPQTTTKLDPNCIENPFLPLRGGSQIQKHNEKKNVQFKENSMTFKSNTLDNPKKLKRKGLVDRGVNCKKASDDAAVKYLSTNSNSNVLTNSNTNISTSSNTNITSKKNSSQSIDKMSTDNTKKIKETTKIKQKYSNVKSKITFSKFRLKPKESVCDKENICSNNTKGRNMTSASNVPKSEVNSANARKEMQRTVTVGSGRVLQFYKAL